MRNVYTKYVRCVQGGIKRGNCSKQRTSDWQRAQWLWWGGKDPHTCQHNQQRSHLSAHQSMQQKHTSDFVFSSSLGFRGTCLLETRGWLIESGRMIQWWKVCLNACAHSSCDLFLLFCLHQCGRNPVQFVPVRLDVTFRWTKIDLHNGNPSFS